MGQFDQIPMFTGELAFLSNFDQTPFLMPLLDAEVASAEHAFNALKTVDEDQQHHVLEAPTPGESKRRGRRVTLRPGWDAGVRVWAMRQVLTAKFAIPALRYQLVRTEGRVLVETNHWHDQYWGSCFCPRHEQTPGTNMLGELLMVIRARHSSTT